MNTPEPEYAAETEGSGTPAPRERFVSPSGPEVPDALTAQNVLRALVDEYRERCLWFLRRDYYPVTTPEMLSVLESIERHGDVEAFRKVAALKRWLLPDSNATSAD